MQYPPRPEAGSATGTSPDASPPDGGLAWLTPAAADADAARLAALRRFGLLAPQVVEALDRVTRLAARALRVPMSVVSLANAEGHLLRRTAGLADSLADRWTTIADPVCRRVTRSRTPLVVDDARVHPELGDGSGVWPGDAVACASVPLLTCEGHALGSLCAIDVVPRAWTAEEVELLRDLAAGVTTEIELRASESHYRAVFEHSPVGIIEGDPTTGVYRANPALQRMFDWPREVTRADIVRQTHPDDREAGEARFLELLTGQRDHYQLEKRYLRPDGTVMWGILSLAAVRDPAGRLETAVGIVQDVSERKQAEEALRDSQALQIERERYLQAVLDSQPECVKVVGTGGQLLDMNRAGLAMIDAESLSQVQGRCVYPLIVEADRPAFQALHEAALDGASGTLEFELVGLRGTRRAMDTRVAPLRDPSGAITGALAVTRDVTERKRLEAQLLQAQKMEAVGLLAGGVAHDFNNLLTVIKAHCEFLALEVADGPAQDVAEIARAATSAADLTRQLLAFSRQQILRPRVVDLNAVLGGVERMLRRLIGEDITMAVLAAPTLAKVAADPAQLEQVLVNLAVNARDAMLAGGRLIIETSEVTIDAPVVHRHGVVAPGAYVSLRVADTGCGMEDVTIARIFEPFFTTKGPGRGTGLGLATVYGIVRQSKGHVIVESAPGAGATFTILLPQVTGEAPEEQAVVATASPRTAGTILLVEDEAGVRTVARRILEREDLVVLEARHGADALRVAKEHAGRIDLVLTDVVMPEMSGRELVEALAEVRPGMRVVYMSGYTDDVVLSRGMLDPRMVFVQKPFTTESLLHAVRTTLAT